MNISIVKVDLPRKVMTSMSDKEFLEKATKTILNNIDDKSFALDRLVVDLKISRTQSLQENKFSNGSKSERFHQDGPA